MKYNIDSHIILEKKIGLVVYTYIMIIIIIALSLIIILTIFHYKTYYKVKGIVEINEDIYIRTYIPLDDVYYITSNNRVKINKTNYKYKIISLSDDFITDNYITYQIVLLKVNLPSKYKFNNLNLDLQFLKEDKKVIDYIIRR